LPKAMTNRLVTVAASDSPGMAMKIYPAWAMLEYASMRLILRCAIATRFPTNIVRAARVHSTGIRSWKTEKGASQQYWRECIRELEEALNKEDKA